MSSICYYYLTNNTPYAWHLLGAKVWFKNGDPTSFPYAGTQNDGVYCQPPVTDIQPGQTSCFALDEETLEYAQAEVYYTFDDVNGDRHRVDYNVDDDGEPVTYAVDLDASNNVVTTNSPTFHMTQDSDSNPLHIDAALSHPAERTIDARTDPTTAAAVMGQFTRGTNQNFTPTAPITYATGPFSRASGLVLNSTTEPALMTLSASADNTQTTSLNVEAGWSTGLQIIGLVNTKVSATVDSGHSWTATDDVTNLLTFPIRPGDVGWIEASVTTATVVGTFDFTTPESITYHVTDVDVTKPGVGPKGQAGAITWQTQQKPVASLSGALDRKADRTRANARCTTGRTRHGHVTTYRCEPPRSTSRCSRYHHQRCQSWARTATDGTVVIDARTDKKAAAAALALYPQATDATFDATAETPFYDNTAETVMSNYFQNPASEKDPATGQLGVSHTDASSWSVGGSIGAEVTLSAFALANASVSATFSAHHEWVTSSTLSESVTVSVDPGYVGWVDGYTRQVRFSGNYRFTVGGTHYQVDNVSITEPGNSEDGPSTAATYIVKAEPIKPSTAKRFTVPGPVSRTRGEKLF